MTMHVHRSITSFLTLIASVTGASPRLEKPSASTIALAGGIPPIDYAYYANPVSQHTTQLEQYVNNILSAAYQYGIDNIPLYGYDGYPRGLVDELRLWKAVSPPH